MNKWSSLRDWLKQESLRSDSWMIPLDLILEKMRELEQQEHRDTRLFFDEPFDGET